MNVLDVVDVLDVDVVVIGAIEPLLKSLQVPHEALEIVGTLINFHISKFEYSICLIV